MIRHQSLPQGDSNTATEDFMRQTIEKLLEEPRLRPAKSRVKKSVEEELVIGLVVSCYNGWNAPVAQPG